MWKDYLEVQANSERDGEPPWRYRKIHIHYQLRGRELNPQAIQRSIDLSENKYCSIYATLREAVEISSDFEIVLE